MNGAPASSNIRAAFSYCVQQVRSYDYHHYLCLLNLPPPLRKPAFALRAFNIETSRTMDVVSDPKLGLMRLLWWQEAIDKIYAHKTIDHPMAIALSSIVSHNKLSKAWLKRSVEARISDANQEGISKIEELERYSEDTVSTLLYLTLQAGGIKSSVADHAASHIGKANGLLLLLKSIPYHASRGGVVHVPLEVASKHGLLLQRGRLKPEPREELSNAVLEVASVASAHLNKAQELICGVPKEAVPVLLPGVAAQVLLDSLERVRFNVFDPRLNHGILGVSPFWFQLKLKWYAWRGKY
ncbi:NADH dehydrogenase (ubiquinone) complex I, assembly factor 6 [Amborella trichopoda]|uniref:Squalene/phytoene synthase n=1 Tax=Amborella trichopoda TaxID=13333 RepID=U5CZD9_AMBTC|nr:NADH dehydrogenase (ubiquinone) complex I, assembly factor 6 [Amborella trichopoda]XP_020528896.1 NADH dehydrogenase (ubiquinone) complex I, assembly factor 6 [Amborella trichopoda]ERN15360.1 hypothetical protein AMTR_s00036p00157620 [Amborella trichopoda]|eukprot:XP_020528895.1 NADH dehydrogenase (ubiquinone) complex I, assembly factor 6 [Amborella trichopoda]